MDRLDIHDIVEQEIDALRTFPTAYFHHAVMLIHGAVHRRGGKLITSGMGKAGHIAHNIATTFSSTGTPAVFLHPSEAQHGDLGVIQPNDIMLVISNSGKTREIIELVHLANRLHKGIQVISITSALDSELVGLSNCTLPTGHTDEVCPLGLTPTTSTTVMTVMGDILISLMMEKIGFTHEEYAKRHHGGYLGEKSRSME